MNAEQRTTKILDEEDPYLREIWAAGWDYVLFDRKINQIVLIKEEGQIEKTIDRINHFDFNVISAVLIDGRIHRWISDGDGSAKRFRDLIKLP